MERLGLFANPILYYVVGAILFIASLGYFFAPGIMGKLLSAGQNPIGGTPKSYSIHPRIMGAFFLVAALFLLYASLWR